MSCIGNNTLSTNTTTSKKSSNVNGNDFSRRKLITKSSSEIIEFIPTEEMLQKM